MANSTKAKIFNFIWFQGIWFLAILYENRFLIVILALLILHVVLSKDKKQDLAFALAIGMYGSVVDGLLIYAGVFEFTSTSNWLIPYWLVCLWIAFGLMLRVSLDYLNHHYLLAAGLGAISGALSYYAGQRFSVVDFPLGLMITGFTVAIIWAITVPLWLWINLKLNDAARVKQ